MLHFSRVTAALNGKDSLLTPLWENESAIQHLCMKTILYQQYTVFLVRYNQKLKTP